MNFVAAGTGGSGPGPGASSSPAALSIPSCSICLEPYVNPKVLKCGHSFCSTCLDELIKQNHDQMQDLVGPTGYGSQFPVVISCPECRASMLISEDNVIPNYRLATVITEFRTLALNAAAAASSTASPTAEASTTVCGVCKEKFPQKHVFFCRSCSKKGAKAVVVCGSCGVLEHQSHVLLPVTSLVTPEKRAKIVAEIQRSIEVADGVVTSYGDQVDALNKELLGISQKCRNLKIPLDQTLNMIKDDAAMSNDDITEIKIFMNNVIQLYSELKETVDRSQEMHVDTLRVAGQNFYENVVRVFRQLPYAQGVFIPPSDAPAIGESNPFMYTKSTTTPDRRSKVRAAGYRLRDRVTRNRRSPPAGNGEA